MYNAGEHYIRRPMRSFDMDAGDALVYCVYEAGNAQCHLAHRGRRAEDVGLEPVPQGPR
jgi:hypothetical protein